MNKKQKFIEDIKSASGDLHKKWIFEFSGNILSFYQPGKKEQTLNTFDFDTVTEKTYNEDVLACKKRLEMLDSYTPIYSGSDKEKIKEATKRFLADKELVQKYLRGEITKAEIDAAGIVLATPVEAK